MELYCKTSINILPTIYQSKSKMPGKIGSVWFIYKKWKVISTRCKLDLSIIFGRTVYSLAIKVIKLYEWYNLVL